MIEAQVVLGQSLAWCTAHPSSPLILLSRLLTLLISLASKRWGANVAGWLAGFPMLGSVLAMFSHQSHGVAFTTVLLRSLSTGPYSLAAFCLVQALGLMVFAPGLGVSILVLGSCKERKPVQD